MELIVKRFQELTVDELFAIYELRAKVFVVEQECAYLDVVDTDKVSYHLWLQGEDGIQAYARVLPQGAVYEEDASIGRVIAAKRRQGLGTRIVAEAIKVAQEKFQAKSISIGAQTYARPLYEKAGFVQTSEEYLLDGLPHIEMKLTL